MIVLSALLFVIGAFAADGKELFGWAWLVWVLAGVAAWVLHGAYPLAMPTRKRSNAG